MNVRGVREVFDALVAEADSTFVTDAIRTTLLRTAHGQFRHKVSATDPSHYAIQATILPLAAAYDLATAAVILLGGGVLTGPRLVRLLKVVNVDAAGLVQWFYRGAGSFEELAGHARMYLLEGTTLHFSDDESGESVRLHYVPLSSVDWTAIDPADTEFIDALDDFHDIIAMLAARQYAVRDGAQNAALDDLLAQRLQEMETHLAQGRVPESGDHVLAEGRGRPGGVW